MEREAVATAMKREAVATVAARAAALCRAPRTSKLVGWKQRTLAEFYTLTLDADRQNITRDLYYKK